MSLASYIGCNIKFPIYDEEDTDALLYIGRCFAVEDEMRTVKKYQFPTTYVYEVSSDWGIEITDYMEPKLRAESKQKLIALCKRMDQHLGKGDFFELYSCWVGEEGDKREGEIALQLNHFDIEELEFPEKTLV